MSQQTDNPPEGRAGLRSFVFRCNMGHEFLFQCSPDPPEGIRCRFCDATAVPLEPLKAAPTPQPTAVPEPPQATLSTMLGEALGTVKTMEHTLQDIYDKCRDYADAPTLSKASALGTLRKVQKLAWRELYGDAPEVYPNTLPSPPASPTARPHRIGVWDYQSLCDCLKHNLEQTIPGYSYRDPQDAIQTLAARVMTLQRAAMAEAQIKAGESDGKAYMWKPCQCAEPCFQPHGEYVRCIFCLGLQIVDAGDGLAAQAKPTAEGPREGLQQLAWNIAKKWGFNRYDRILNEMVPTSEAMNALAEMTAAALERAAQIAEEHGVHEEGHGRCPKAIAAEIRKLAEDL